jgi:hypothetical protein
MSNRNSSDDQGVVRRPAESRPEGRGPEKSEGSPSEALAAQSEAVAKGTGQSERAWSGESHTRYRLSKHSV